MMFKISANRKNRIQAAFVALACLSVPLHLQAVPQAPLIHGDGHYLSYGNGSAFFPVADTQWELTHRATREEVDTILDNRKHKGFNAINLAVMFHWATMEANAYGHLAGKPGEWNPDYWSHVDYVVNAILERDMHPILFPAWGNLMGGENNLFTKKSAFEFGQWIAKRYSHPAILFVLGGDREPNIPIVDAVGRGIKSHLPNHLVSFHPYNSKSSSLYFADAPWLDLNMIQSGHETVDQLESHGKITRLIKRDFEREPVKPIIDIEPRYEAYYPHDNPPPFTSYDTRVAAYWAVFSGSAGIGYAHNQLWQWGRFTSKDPVIQAQQVWDYLDSPASFQIPLIKKLLLSRDYFSRRPAQELLSSNINGITVVRGDNYVLAYSYRGESFELNLSNFSTQALKGTWFNPRNGKMIEISTVIKATVQLFDPPGDVGVDNDWVLVLDE